MLSVGFGVANSDVKGLKSVILETSIASPWFEVNVSARSLWYLLQCFKDRIQKMSWKVNAGPDICHLITNNQWYGTLTFSH